LCAHARASFLACEQRASASERACLFCLIVYAVRTRACARMRMRAFVRVWQRVWAHPNIRAGCRFRLVPFHRLPSHDARCVGLSTDCALIGPRMHWTSIRHARACIGYTSRPLRIRRSAGSAGMVDVRTSNAVIGPMSA
jgi:hypothetical protein